MATQFIGTRLKALRAEHNLSQDDLARLLGFKDRQTVSAIENGVRRVTADELVLAVEKLDVALDYFTDPFRLVGEGRFSWRQKGVGPEQLGKHEHDFGCLVAAYRALAPRVGRELPLMRRAMCLTRHSRFEDAMREGSRFVAEFGLGDIPATGLVEVMERKLGILVLMVDADEGVSGAACRLPELDSVLIARRGVEGRRNFDLAHELFHILTWDTLPPKHCEEVLETGGNRAEQLANNFAAAVLMPAATLDRRGDWGTLGEDRLITQLNAVADELHVPSSALRWRLVALGHLRHSVARSLAEPALCNNGRRVATGAMPALYSKPFVEVLSLAIKGGHVSMRRVAGLLDRAVDELTDLFAPHGVELPVEL